MAMAVYLDKIGKTNNYFVRAHGDTLGVWTRVKSGRFDLRISRLRRLRKLLDEGDPTNRFARLEDAARARRTALLSSLMGEWVARGYEILDARTALDIARRRPKPRLP